MGKNDVLINSKSKKMTQKILRLIFTFCLGLMVIGCGSLNVAPQKKAQKTSLPPNVGSNKYSEKRNVN